MLTRDRAIEALRGGRFDVAVIGGGITGAGVALDAASRGYSVALVEQGDFAAGTSSRSSKLVHGGLRYLQRLDLGLVREALLERELMSELAPHLVRPLPFVVPAFDGARLDRLVGLGLNMYDAMATSGLRGRSAARHRRISGAEVAELLPALAGRRPTGGYLFYDCQTDDARLVLSALGEAERFGAVCANRLRASVAGAGGAAALTVEDAETGETFPLRAGHVVSATGVWADRVAPAGPNPPPRIIPSRGAHVTVALTRLPLEAGAIVPAAHGRSVFALPWLGRALIGTTDSVHDGPLDHVRPAPEDVEYLLDAVNRFFELELDRDDLTGAYAGVRPLVAAGDGRRTVDISRRAELYESGGGLLTITGGKLTTWRRMAKLAVDRLVERDGRRAPCRTHEIPLGAPVDPSELPRLPGLEDAAYDALAARYGHAAHRVLELAAADPELARPIVPGLPDLLAEAPFSARHEQARGVGDVLLRRTRLGLLAAPQLSEPGARAPRRVASALAAELGWDEARSEQELERFRAEAGAEGLAPVAAP